MRAARCGGAAMPHGAGGGHAQAGCCCGAGTADGRRRARAFAPPPTRPARNPTAHLHLSRGLQPDARWSISSCLGRGTVLRGAVLGLLACTATPRVVGGHIGCPAWPARRCCCCCEAGSRPVAGPRWCMGLVWAALALALPLLNTAWPLLLLATTPLTFANSLKLGSPARASSRTQHSLSQRLPNAPHQPQHWALQAAGSSWTAKIWLACHGGASRTPPPAASPTGSHEVCVACRQRARHRECAPAAQQRRSAAQRTHHRPRPLRQHRCSRPSRQPACLPCPRSRASLSFLRPARSCARQRPQPSQRVAMCVPLWPRAAGYSPARRAKPRQPLEHRRRAPPTPPPPHAATHRQLRLLGLELLRAQPRQRRLDVLDVRGRQAGARALRHARCGVAALRHSACALHTRTQAQRRLSCACGSVAALPCPAPPTLSSALRKPL